MKKLVLILAVLIAMSVIMAYVKSTSAQQVPDEFRRQIGTIIVTPGNGPSLGVADFQPRASGIDAMIGTFNEVLWNDLRFAGVANLVGKSLYPKTKIADPASLRFEEWGNDPVKADYLAFGSLVAEKEAQGFLYDIKTKQQILTARLSGDAREMAHQFADQIVKALSGLDGISTSKMAYINGSEVSMMDYDGYGARAFTSDGSTALFPALSPDGKRLAYVSFRNIYPNIVIRRIDGGGILGSTQYKATTTSPTIAPDGRLAFSSSKDGDAMELYVSGGDGSSPKRLTRTRNSINISPRWNPKTGREIAFISDRGGSPQIYITDADGTSQRPLLPSSRGHMDSPAWSPDGRFIAFTWDGGGGPFHIYLADVATGQVLKLTDEGRNEFPTWSPDSRHIAFQSNRSGRWEVWVMHIDGSEPKQLTRSGGRFPSWSK